MSLLSESDFIYIIGSPRSGTTWLQIMVAAHPQVVTTMELTLFENYLIPWLMVWKLEKENINAGKWVKGLPHLWSDDEFYGFLKEFLDRGYAKVHAKRPDARYILDKAPENAFHTDVINQFIPHCRFIHIIRDGRDVVCSMRNAKRRAGHQTEDIAQASEIWRNSVNAARNAAKFQDRYLEVRYEELLQNGGHVLKQVFDFCDIRVSEHDIAEIYDQHSFEIMKRDVVMPDPEVTIRNPHSYYKGQAGTWKEELSSEEQTIFYNIAGELLVSLGYSDVTLEYARSQHKTMPSFFKNRLKYLAMAVLGTTITAKLKALGTKRIG